MRDAPGQPWREPVSELGGDGSWESAEDAEMVAREFRLRAAAEPTAEIAARLGFRQDQILHQDPVVVVLPDGERPDDSMQVHTLPSGQQIPLPRAR